METGACYSFGLEVLSLRKRMLRRDLTEILKIMRTLDIMASEKLFLLWRNLGLEVIRTNKR